jgi:hypothetical protein
LKYATLVQEGIRRLTNTNEYVTKTEKLEIMDQYNARLRRSGYKGLYRQKVIQAAHQIYRSKVEVSKTEGGRPLHRDKQYQKEQRQVEKELKKVCWYRKSKRQGGQITHAPLIVSPTYDGELSEKLKKICQDVADNCGLRVKVMERGGSKIKDVVKSNPTGDKECGRSLCLVCNGETPGGCQTYGITYEVICITCRNSEEGQTQRTQGTSQGPNRGEGGKKVLYTGETGDNAYNRGIRHLESIRRMDPSNALAKHCIIAHNSTPAKFSMKVLQNFRGCLMRQEGEAVKIRFNMGKADEIMNSRKEFHQPPIKRVVIARGNVQETQIGDQTEDMRHSQTEQNRTLRHRETVRNRTERQNSRAQLSQLAQSNTDQTIESVRRPRVQQPGAQQQPEPSLPGSAPRGEAPQRGGLKGGEVEGGGDRRKTENN